MLPYFANLALQLYSVTVVIGEVGVVFCVPVIFTQTRLNGLVGESRANFILTCLLFQFGSRCRLRLLLEKHRLRLVLHRLVLRVPQRVHVHHSKSLAFRHRQVFVKQAAWSEAPH